MEEYIFIEENVDVFESQLGSEKPEPSEELENWSIELLRRFGRRIGNENPIFQATPKMNSDGSLCMSFKNFETGVELSIIIFKPGHVFYEGKLRRFGKTEFEPRDVEEGESSVLLTTSEFGRLSSFIEKHFTLKGRP